jgi:hypothetical protein
LQVVRSAQTASAAAEEVASDLQKATVVLNAVQQAVDAGDLPAALHNLRDGGGLSGQAAAITDDWARAVESRVATDQAISVVRARAAVLAASVW